MLQLVYVSTAAVPAVDASLQDILVQARDRNLATGITGVLLYHDASFIQALEGPSAAVHDTFGRIRRDRRHHSIVTLCVNEIDERDFPNWQMGFVPIDPDNVLHVQGFADLRSQHEAPRPGRAHDLLKRFRLALAQPSRP